MNIMTEQQLEFPVTLTTGQADVVLNALSEVVKANGIGQPTINAILIAQHIEKAFQEAHPPEEVAEEDQPKPAKKVKKGKK